MGGHSIVPVQIGEFLFHELHELDQLPAIELESSRVQRKLDMTPFRERDGPVAFDDISPHPFSRMPHARQI
jgi:hypothetical protein